MLQKLVSGNVLGIIINFRIMLKLVSNHDEEKHHQRHNQLCTY